MLLVRGTLLGPYEILAPIGKGGMGEVYKARDTRLGRIVAIKVSQERFSERFEHEARAVAALNHPHICALYDVGSNYLVMEYIDGTPLKGPLPIDLALKYAAQVCSALDAAHKKNIVHRDLKPGNILVAKQGVKLLDFGLARMAAGADDPTLTASGEGMGTPAYMSPEQWAGKPADARSDIYSLGCVLYEMLTGKRAAEDLSGLASQPVRMTQILRTCLEKDPEDRWQTAREVNIALERSVESPPLPSRNPWRDRAMWAALGALFIAAMWFLLRPSIGPPAGEMVSFLEYPPDGAAFFQSDILTVNVPQFAISHDGRKFVFVAAPSKGAKPMLWRRPIGEANPQILKGTEGADGPFWSPDDRWVGFFAEGQLRKVPSEGGTVQFVATETNARGASWGADDTILYASGATGLMRVSSNAGQVTSASILQPGEGSHRYPQFLPDGRRFLYLVTAGDKKGIYLGSLDDTAKHFLMSTTTSAAYAPAGYLLYVEGDTLWARSLDVERLRVGEQRFPIADHVGRNSAFFSAVSVSMTGAIAYASTIIQNGRLKWFDRSGTPQSSIGVEGCYIDFRLSPDDKILAASLLDPITQVVDVWITQLERGGRTKVTTGQGTVSGSPVWSHDSTRFVYRSNRNGGLNEFFERSVNTGDERHLLSTAKARASQIQSGALVPTDWSPRAPYNLLFSVPGPPTSASDLWLLPLSADGNPEKLIASPTEDEMHGNFSPDGALIAYTLVKSGQPQVFVTGFPQPKEKWLVSVDGGYEPRWSATGEEIYFLSLDRFLMAVKVSRLSGGPQFDKPRKLFQTNVPAGVSPNRMHYVPRKDGQQFLINTESPEQSTTPITVVLNWMDKLKK